MSEEDDGDTSRQAVGWSRVIIMSTMAQPISHGVIESWHAVLESEASPFAAAAEFEGSLDAALTWARDQKPSELFVYDPTTRELVRSELPQL